MADRMTDTTKGAALPAAAEQLASPTAAAALDALDDLEGAARGDQPFPYFAAPVIRQFIEASIAHPPAAAPPVWIQPDHLAKARSAPFLCRVEPTQRDDFVPLYAHPPAAAPAGLQQQIMDLANSGGGYVEEFARSAYNAGHRDARHAAAELVGGTPAAATDKDCWQAREAGGTGPICEPCNTGNRDKCLYKRAAGAPAVTCGCRLGVKLSPWQCPVHGEPAQPDTEGQQP